MEIVVKPSHCNNTNERQKNEPQKKEPQKKYFDYSQRALWLRAVVLGGNEGLISTTLLMVGLETISSEVKPLILTSFATLVAAALCMATSEFVSVYTQVDIMTSQVNRDLKRGRRGPNERPPLIPSPTQVAVAASVAYLIGGMVPLMVAGLIRDEKLRSVVAVIAACSSMLVLGIIGAALGKAPIARSCARVITGGWIMIAIIFGKSKFLQIIGVNI